MAEEPDEEDDGHEEEPEGENDAYETALEEEAGGDDAVDELEEGSSRRWQRHWTKARTCRQSWRTKPQHIWRTLGKRWRFVRPGARFRPSRRTVATRPRRQERATTAVAQATGHVSARIRQRVADPRHAAEVEEPPRAGARIEGPGVER